MSWTEAQENAIKARDCNLLVAAAAGSGKTAVLVERIIQLVLKDGVDIDRMLIVTFTQAAAGEMRERISNALQSELEGRPENEQNLRRQLKLLNQASISTIHAFCTDVIRCYFHLVGIDPGFRISDSMESDLIKMETLEDLFEAEYEKATPIFLNLVESFGSSRSDQSLQELVLRAYEFAQCKPYPQQWLEARACDFNLGEEEFPDCVWVRSIMEQIAVQVQAAGDLFRKALQLCYQPSGPAVYADALLDDIGMVEELLQILGQGNIFDLAASLGDINHTRLSRVGQDVDSNLKEQAQKLRDEGKKLIGGAGSEFLFKEPAKLLHDLNELYPLMEEFCRLVIDFNKEYAKRKADKSLLDFNDLEHYALTILSNPEAAGEYRQKYQYIFVDEYQDSNEVQETLINCIKRDNNVFLVGDIKQSIYRFRLADPTLFIQKMEQFQESGGKLNQRIDLSINFRSREEILNGANYIFTHIMSPYLGEITYDTRAALYPGLENSDSGNEPVEVYLIDKNREDDEEDELAQAGDAEIEARLAARKIKELLGQPIYDHKIKNHRPLEYRDMVVLMRSTRNSITAFWDILAAEGIPVYADLGSGYFESSEITLILNLLRLIDNRRQDIPLLSIMRSPIGGFTLDELIEIRVQSQARSYYEAMEAYRAVHDNELKDKLQRFMEDLTRWKEEARYLPIDEFIWKLLHETGYFYYAGAMPGGRQRQANLKALLERARQFQDTSIKGLFNFIKYVDKIQARSGDMGVARILGENENLVRIMSIHRSKGLEFPVVILAGLGKQFNLSDSSERILFHKDMGIGPRYVNPDLRGFNETIARISIKHKIRLENLSEEMRILYVGCTRPQHKLIMIGSVKDVEKNVQKWSSVPTPFNLARGKNPLDWVAPVLMRHPDGGILRELAGVSWTEADLQNDPSRWQVEILKRSDIGGTDAKAAEMLGAFYEEVEQHEPGSDCELVSQRLGWNYPFEQAERIPSKVSVSQLQEGQVDPALMGIEIHGSLTRPRFVEGIKELTPAHKGIIMHFVMQHLDFTRVQDQKAIRQQVETMVRQEMLLEDEAKTVNTTKIFRFFRSPLGQRILNAREVEREVPFNQLRYASEVMDNVAVPDEKMLVQGVIDLFFYEGDQIVLVDFKTDYVTEENREELISYYQPQLKLYKEALETIQGKKVKESYLYFFGIDEAVLLKI
ncbi:MAG: helicase-exonuclease AddAB subunit AddA [Syntrophomonadaceae bacterium]|nr:helicase-exonuclease AddAB subunit AddA [Syntrophomonadaceae bacterium]